MDFLLTCFGTGFVPKGVLGVITATGGTGKSFLLLNLAVVISSVAPFGPIQSVEPVSVLFVAGEDPQSEVDRRLWDICDGAFPPGLHACSVYGEIGPLMRLENGTPTRADGFYWLEQTIKNHKGLEVLILDPKSRFYGLNENDSDHATQWIQSLEYLAKTYQLTILFSHHTGKTRSDQISQHMSRGSSAIVDGCRWQAGLVRLDKKKAQKFGLKEEEARKYIELDVPKSNYAPDISKPLCFKKDKNGILIYSNPKEEGINLQADLLLDILKMDDEKFTLRDLLREKKCVHIYQEMTETYEDLKRQDIHFLIQNLIERHKISIKKITVGCTTKEIIKIA